MPTDYYDDSPPESQAATPEEQEESRGDDKTALIPSSLCPGMDVGDEVVLEIVGVHEDEYEVKYAPKKKGEDEAKTDTEPSTSRPSESMEGGGMGSFMD